MMRRALAPTAVAMVLVLLTALPAAALSVLRTIPVGSQPFGVAVAGGLVYVANSGGSSVAVIDTASDAVVGSIAVGGGPGEIVVDGGRAYVGNFNDATVSVVDTATRMTVATLSPGGLGVAVDPGLHRLYATSGARLTVFDTDTLQPVATLTAPAAGGWWAVAVDGATHRVYLADLGGTGIAVVDGTSNTIVATIVIGSPIRFALAVDPAARRLVAAGDTSAATLSIIDTSSNTVINRTTVGDFPSHVVFDPSHRAVVTGLGSNDVAVVDVASMNVTRTSLGSRPAGLAFSGGQLYVALNGSNAVAVLGNSTPVVDSAIVSPAQPRTNDVLTATVSAHDADGDTLTFGYQWTRNGADIAAATSASLDLSVAGHGDRGDSIAVRVIANDGSLSSAPFTSVPVVISDSPPQASVALDPSTPTTKTVLVATATASDPDADPLAFTYVWKVNGITKRTTVTGATSDSLDLGQPGNGNKGDVVEVELTASDGMLSSGLSSATVTVARGH